MAGQIVVMRGGEIEQRGAPAEVYNRPASLFVANFISSLPINFYSGSGGPGDRDRRPPQRHHSGRRLPA
jgi:ABC-type sugar transport system ATPase subunit